MSLDSNMVSVIIVLVSIIVLKIKPTIIVRGIQFKETPAKWGKANNLWKWRLEKRPRHTKQDKAMFVKSETKHDIARRVKSLKSGHYHDDLVTRTFGPGGITNSDSFNEAVLHAHNQYRQMHHSPHLYLDTELSRQAQAYAKELSLFGPSRLRHSNGYDKKNYGENIFVACDTHVFPIDPAKKWYSQVCKYDFLAHKSKKRGEIVEDFTQVVWRGTDKVGVGRAIGLYNNKPCTYIVANYLNRRDHGGPERNNVDIGDFNKEICKDFSYAGFGAVG